ncbi:Asp-tRNA(Asn)/Glu-tRNA(Gln) amidotransferase subunit GatB [Roseospira navarrensis]|uniref:Aspartyl/glutamyl-tRNA(Asn/Gln) amidotransferase subunit B n=1 Tax=Roseospira navarrensis TaxID=140058 RepID=A0A7X1ZGM9_9PROT|nr:Asp-tRNA(Asn)/Glu-tRNA(Gln) amidotransferase subunit GatB [Roseospira navarrensis]MQX36870.1 Asp-tRNA(Asn)/Glu-tRNA(Gln) amidotransferase subunit GatB [Roseospira navarrensis]
MDATPAPTYVLSGETGDWEVVIGLEVHAQVISHAKLFSGASTTFGADPNSQVSLVDAAMPGMLPVINRACVEQAVRTGLGLRAHINHTSVFARKNYFYADLPQGYQISQYELPIVGEGTLILDMPDGSSRTVGIERLHLEQDAGKSMHDQHPSKSFIDLNRSGVALMEIVSKPDMRSPEEAGAYLRKLRSILRYLGTCDGNMEEGSMRADVNVSVRKVGETGLRTRCEVKNVNSVRFVMQAIEAEATRHIEVWESGGEVIQETRLFDPAKGETRSMRSKEEAHDYRYFPDPDLLPLEFDDAFVDGIRATLPELPDDKKARFISDVGLTPYDASVLVVDRREADFFEAVAKDRDGKTAANWVISTLFGTLNKMGVGIDESPVSAENLGKLIDLIADDTISGRIAKDVYEIMVETGEAPDTIVEERGLKQVKDTGAIEAAIDEVMAANPDKVEQVRGGKEKLLGWFTGQVMKATQGKANPGMVNDLLKKKILG